MIKATIQNNPYCTEIDFPCTETELLEKLGAIGIDKEHLAPTGMVIDKISEVNALCEKVKYMHPSDEKAFIERLENEDVHGAAQMFDVADEMGMEAAYETNRYDYVEEDEEPIMEQRM